jgi:ABC-type glycerol-3-phosphate transport system permease component
MSNPLTTDDAPGNLLMAVSVVSSLPPVCLSYPVRRHPTAGLVSGAVAGT